MCAREKCVQCPWFHSDAPQKEHGMFSDRDVTRKLGLARLKVIINSPRQKKRMFGDWQRSRAEKLCCKIYIRLRLGESWK